MRVVNRKYKIRDLKTNGIKIVGYAKYNWYKTRSRYETEALYNNKGIEAFNKALKIPIINKGIVCTLYPNMK